MERKVKKIKDVDGNESVVIYDIRFKGSRAIQCVLSNDDCTPSDDGKMYLYDIMNIKKKQAPISGRETLLSQKLVSFLGIS